MYFIQSRLNRYIDYFSKNKLTIEEVIKRVNCNIDKGYYNNVKEAKPLLNNLILVNKFYKLDENYIPSDLVKIDNKYSIKGMIKKEVNDYFIKMVNDASKENLCIINASPYRSYKRQQELYEGNDDSIARPGYSEHQTGLAIDLRTKDKDIEEFETSKEYEWMINNCYKYGFILRYPKGMEVLTGYKFEPWHYRYVGVKVSKYIYENDITFDEYYAYYIEKEDI